MNSEDRSGSVSVKPFRRTWLPEGHDGEIRYTNCAEFLAVPINVSSNEMVTGLTDSEERALEDELLLEPKTLSKHNKSFWSSYKQMIRIDKSGLTLDKSKPWDYIKYKNLTVHPKVSPNEASKFDNPEYEYVITSLEQEAKFRNQINRVKRDAYKEFGKLGLSEMKNVMKIYGNKTDDSHSQDVIEAKLADYIENDPQGFIDVVKDPNFKMKVFVADCIAIYAIRKNGPKYTLNGGDLIGMSLEEAIAYLENPQNQDVYISLKSKLEVGEKIKVQKPKAEAK